MNKIVRLSLAALITILLAVCLAGCGSNLTPEEMTEQKDAWAQEIMNDAFADLAEQGIIDEFADDAQMLDDVFEYKSEYGGYGIDFADADAARALTSDFDLGDAKVAFCDPDYNNEMLVYCLNGDSDKYGGTVPDDAPFFYPESAFGCFSVENMDTMLDGVDPGRFASSFKDCDYLIAYDSVYTHVDEDYYLGSIDRTSTTTFAVIVDVKKREVVHIETIGTDTPGSTVQMGGQTGQLLYHELIAYLNSLLK